MERVGFYKVSLPEYTEDEMAVLTTAAFMAGFDGEDNVRLTQLAKKMGMSLGRGSVIRDRLNGAFQSLHDRKGDLTMLRILEDGSTRKTYRVQAIQPLDAAKEVALLGEEWQKLCAPYQAGARYALGTDLRVFMALRANNMSLAQGAADTPYMARLQDNLDYSPFKWHSAVERLKAAGVESKVC